MGRQLKILGIIVVTATALAALVGTPSAFAAVTKLCKANEAVCSAGNTYASGTKIEAETKSGGATWSGLTEGSRFTTNLGTVVCDSKLKGETNAASGEPLPASVTSLTFASCSISVGGGTTACEVGLGTGSANNLPYKSSLEAFGGGNGSLTAASGGGGQPGMSVQCGAILSCSFSEAPIALSFTGGAPMVAYVTANEVAFAIVMAGKKCPTRMNWLAQYFWISPNSNAFLTHSSRLASSLRRARTKPATVGYSSLVVKHIGSRRRG
jgi:hypothetical protein